MTYFQFPLHKLFFQKYFVKTQVHEIRLLLKRGHKNVVQLFSSFIVWEKSVARQNMTVRREKHSRESKKAIKNKRLRGPFSNYVDKFLAFFDHLPTRVDKKEKLLYYKISIQLTFPVPTTYFSLVNVVWELPLYLKKQKNDVPQIFPSYNRSEIIMYCVLRGSKTNFCAGILIFSLKFVKMHGSIKDSSPLCKSKKSAWQNTYYSSKGKKAGKERKSIHDQFMRIDKLISCWQRMYEVYDNDEYISPGNYSVFIQKD